MSVQVEALLEGDRRALGKAITLVESSREDHRREAVELIHAVLPHTGKAIRLGISGAPGVGKSTFIDAFGNHVIDDGHRLAVLAVDPSSSRSGGSILGDKTRMEDLARRSEAFIRPSPAGRTLGGVARRTREAMLLCEAAGFDVVIVETVGVGQSETAVADMVDLFCLLASPGGGDDLQGIKRGVMELAELVVVTKADGDLLPAANRAAGDLRHALHLMRPLHEAWTARVLSTSSYDGTGLTEVWDAVQEHRTTLQEAGALAPMRAEQLRRWLWSELREGLVERFVADAGERLAAAERDVIAGRVLPAVAADDLLDTP
ncbi:methylmalonyl Co-A mutase-associated GTPase MeaB [Actinospongicola halichondriae]|uniref:methylmalonyl Co-A mutase-associated GTPase MeaB n=1 Tax=Actinospongicola halichondriae TaxID=3236844 RepID=UPI003D49590D